MEDKNRTFGESARDNANVGSEPIGHGVEDVLSREDRGGKIERTERSSQDVGGEIERTERSSGTQRTERTVPAETTAPRESAPATNIPGNTSETGATPQPTGTGLPRTTLPSPLKRPAGCSAPTATLFIATVSLLMAGLRHHKS